MDDDVLDLMTLVLVGSWLGMLALVACLPAWLRLHVWALLNGMLTGYVLSRPLTIPMVVGVLLCSLMSWVLGRAVLERSRLPLTN